MSNQTSITLTDLPQIIERVLDQLEDDIQTNNTMFDLVPSRTIDIVRQLRVLDSEATELATAIFNSDQNEYFDGLGDCIYVIGSLRQLSPSLWLELYSVREAIYIVSAALGGLNPKDWEAVLLQATQIAMSNNLTKSDTTYVDALATQNYYLSKGIKSEVVELGEALYVVKSIEDDPAKDVVVGKVLKSSTRHKRPNFSVMSQYSVSWREII